MYMTKRIPVLKCICLMLFSHNGPDFFFGVHVCLCMCTHVASKCGVFMCTRHISSPPLGDLWLMVSGGGWLACKPQEPHPPCSPHVQATCAPHMLAQHPDVGFQRRRAGSIGTGGVHHPSHQSTALVRLHFRWPAPSALNGEGAGARLDGDGLIPLPSSLPHTSVLLDTTAPLPPASGSTCCCSLWPSRSTPRTSAVRAPCLTRPSSRRTA